ncbi:sugar kinase [Virgibacillus natechei]
MEVVAIGESMVAMVNEPSGYIRHADGFKPFAAGAETNTLIGLSRLGHDTSWISALGEDELGELILHKVRAENVTTSHVKFKDERTGVFFKQISPDGNVNVTYYRDNSAASHMTVEDINIEAIKKAKVLYLTGITLSLSSLAKKMMFEVARQVKDEVIIVFDPNIRLKMWTEAEARKTILEFLPFVDCLIVGKSEVDILLDTKDFGEVLDTFKGFGCKKIVLKLGKEGAIYDFDGKRGQVPNPKQFKEIDPVGAGDAFAAGVISGLLKKQRAEDLVGRACLLGGYITQFVGDYQGFPSEKLMESTINDSGIDKVKR